MDIICTKMSSIFQSHGATRLSPPCLRPRDQNIDTNLVNGPAEFINDQGYVLLMREDLTVNFARAIARCGLAANNVKRYDIDKVFHESAAGGQPNESIEASFDIVSDASNVNLMKAETILVLCRVMALLTPLERTTIEAPPITLQSPIWFLRLNHTRLSDGEDRKLCRPHIISRLTSHCCTRFSNYGFTNSAQIKDYQAGLPKYFHFHHSSKSN